MAFLLFALHCFLAWFILQPPKRRLYAPPKRQLTFNALHPFKSQKIVFFINIHLLLASFRNLGSNIKGGTQTEGVWEQGTDENIWTEEG
jgi:hypothetical protein